MSAAPPGDRGETLVELLIALAIMAITVVAVVGGLVSYISVSDIHRKQATAGAGVLDYGEAVQKSVTTGGYTACASPSSYAAAAVGYVPPAGYASAVQSVRYWSGSTWVSTCSPGSDVGLQRVSLQVASTDTRAVEITVVVLRNPCGIGTSCAS